MLISITAQIFQLAVTVPSKNKEPLMRRTIWQNKHLYYLMCSSCPDRFQHIQLHAFLQQQPSFSETEDEAKSAYLSLEQKQCLEISLRDPHNNTSALLLLL